MGMKENGITVLIFGAIVWLIHFSLSWIPPLFMWIGRVSARVILWVYGMIMHSVFKRPLLEEVEEEVVKDD